MMVYTEFCMFSVGRWTGVSKLPLLYVQKDLLTMNEWFYKRTSTKYRSAFDKDLCLWLFTVCPYGSLIDHIMCPWVNWKWWCDDILEEHAGMQAVNLIQIWLSDAFVCFTAWLDPWESVVKFGYPHYKNAVKFSSCSWMPGMMPVDLCSWLMSGYIAVLTECSNTYKIALKKSVPVGFETIPKSWRR